MHPGQKISHKGRQIRQTTIQKPQQDRDHVRSPQRLEACCDTLRQVPDRLPVSRRSRRNRPVLAMSPDPKDPEVLARRKKAELFEILVPDRVPDGYLTF